MVALSSVEGLVGVQPFRWSRSIWLKLTCNDLRLTFYTTKMYAISCGIGRHYHSSIDPRWEQGWPRKED